MIEPSTYRGYEIELRTRLKPAFGHLKLRQITRPRIETYLADLDASDTLSRKTINDSLIPLRQILGRAVRDGAIATNPAENADRDDPLELPYETPPMSYLNREDARAYLDAAPDWYRALAETLIGAGLRIGEAIALEWRDVSWDAGVLAISRTVKVGGTGTPKGDKARNVVIAGYLLDVLRDHRADQAREGQVGPLVFMSPTGCQLDRHNVRRRGHDVTLRDAALPSALRLHDYADLRIMPTRASATNVLPAQESFDAYGGRRNQEPVAQATSWSLAGVALPAGAGLAPPCPVLDQHPPADCRRGAAPTPSSGPWIMPTSPRRSPHQHGSSDPCRHNPDVGIIVVMPMSAQA